MSGDERRRRRRRRRKGGRRRRRRRRRNEWRGIAFEEERKLERGVVCEPDIGLEETDEEELEEGRRRERIRCGWCRDTSGIVRERE